MEKINYQEPFNLFDEIDQYVVDAIKEMPPEKVQKYVKWDGFIESVQRITFWIGYDENNSRVALDNTYYFARFAGYYLSTHYNERYMMYWKRTLESSFWSYKANIPEERIDDFLEARCIVKFNYIYGFMANGLDILVIDSFFCEAMANIFRLKEKYEVLLGLEWILRKRNALDQVDRIKDFSDDRDYMNYLHSNNLELLIGSKYVLANKNYSLTHEFEKLTENWKVIYTMLMENGLALKRDSIKVCIHSIEVEIRSQNISDEKQSYNKETELYTYSIYSGMPIDFKENELEAFLHDNRKVIEISAKISVQTATERIGTLIVEK